MSEIVQSAVIKVEVDATGVASGMDQASAKVEQSTAKIGRSLANLGGTSEKSGKSASDAIGKIGDGGAAASAKVDSSTKNMISAIQRATAAMSSGAKGSAEYYASLANTRGLNVSALKPYLDQLDAMTSKTKLAADAQKQLDESTKFLDGLKSRADSFGKTASQLAEIRAAQLGVTDAAGPMIAKMRDAEGSISGVGGALKSMAGYAKFAIAGMAGFIISSLVKDSALLAARFETMGVVMGVAGNNAGYTRVQMMELEKQMQKTGISMIASREVLTSLATANIDLANATKLGRAAQDLAVVGNINSSEALTRMVQGIKSGEVEVLRTLGLNVSFENSYKKLADTLDVSKDSLTEQQKVMARTNSVLEESVRYTGIYEESMTTAGKAINSLTRYWDDFKVKAGDAFLPSLSDAVFNLTDALKAANKELEKTGSAGTISSIGQGLASAFKTVYETVVVLGANVGYVFAMIAGEIKTIATQAVAFAHLDFKGAKGIGEEWIVEANAARKAVDAFSDSIVNGAKKQAAAAGMTEASRIAAGKASKDAESSEAARAKWGKIVEENQSKQVKLAKEISAAELAGAAAGKSRADIEKVISDIRAKSAGAGAGKSAEAIIKKEETAYTSLITTIGEKIAAGKLEINGYSQLSESQKLTIKLDEAILTGKNKLTPAHIANARAMIETVASQDAVIASQKRAMQGAADMAKVFKDYQDAADKSILSANQEADKNEELARTFGMTKTAIEQLELSRLEEQLAQRSSTAMTMDEIENLEKLIDAKKRNAAAVGSIDAQEVAKKASEEMAADWKKSVEQYDDVFRKGFADMVNNGKGSWKSFTTSLVTTFKTTVADQIYKMFAQPFVVRMVASLLGVVGGSAVSGMASAAEGSMGGGTSAISMLSGVKSAYSAITNGFSGISTSVTNGVQAGMNLYQGSSSAAAMGAYGPTAAGGNIATSATATGAGTVASYAAGMAAGKVLGGAISGKYEVGNHGSAIVNIGTAIGAIWGPLGAAIGGAIGGLVNRAFGMGPKEVKSAGIEGNFGAAGFAGNEFANWKQDGGWFRSDKSGHDTSNLDTATQKQFTDGFAAIKSVSSDFAASLGIDASSIASYSEKISITLTNDAAKNQEIITKMFTDLGDHVASAIAPGLASFANAGESSGATLQRLATSLSAANGMFDTLGVKLYAASLAGGDMASKLADQFGGLANMQSASAAYFTGYYSEQEKASTATRQLTQNFADMGFSMPQTKVALRSLIESLDLTTESGRKSYAALLAVAPAFASVSDAVEKVAKDVSDGLIATFTTAGDIDFIGLGKELATANTETFVATMALAFTNLAERIKGVIDGISTERAAVRDAALQIASPAVMSKDAIQRGIAGINVNMPGNSGLIGAAGWLQSAEAQKQVAESKSTGANWNVSNVNSNIAATKSAALSKQAALDTAVAYRDFMILKAGLGGDLWRQYRDAIPFAQVAAGYASADSANANASAAYALSQLSSAQQLAADATAALTAANNNYAAATNYAKAQQLAYSTALQDFAIDAGKSVSKLGKLREETVKYYDAQKQLADLMGTSAAGLRESVRITRMGQLDSTQNLAQRQGDFQTNYSMALATTGATQAGYSDKLAAALPDLSTALMDTASTREEWSLATAKLLNQSESIAALLDAGAPKDYAADSLVMLQSIDVTLAALDASASSAEKIISDAIRAGSDKTAGGLHAVVAALTGQSIPGFATGGDFGGGLRIVGENGPELEATGPSRIFNAGQTRSMLSGGNNDAMVQELRALREEVRGLRAEAQATAGYTSKTARLLDRAMPDGDALATRVAA